MRGFPALKDNLKCVRTNLPQCYESSAAGFAVDEPFQWTHFENRTKRENSHNVYFFPKA